MAEEKSLEDLVVDKEQTQTWEEQTDAEIKDEQRREVIDLEQVTIRVSDLHPSSEDNRPMEIDHQEKKRGRDPEKLEDPEPKRRALYEWSHTKEKLIQRLQHASDFKTHEVLHFVARLAFPLTLRTAEQVRLLLKRKPFESHDDTIRAANKVVVLLIRNGKCAVAYRTSFSKFEAKHAADWNPSFKHDVWVSERLLDLLHEDWERLIVGDMTCIEGAKKVILFHAD